MGEKQRNSRIMQAAEARSANKAPKQSRSTGLGRVIIAVYGILALAATVRAVYQIMSKFDEAPIAYSLSLVSGLIYILATFSLSSAKRGAWLVSLYAVAIEWVGGIVVGIKSLTHPEEFAHPSVWSGFGEGYGYVPLVLPLIGLWWLYRNRNERHV